MSLRRVLIGETLIGNVSNYPAHPAEVCPKCGEKLFRVFNTSSDWKFFCVSEKLLVAPGVDPVRASIE